VFVVDPEAMVDVFVMVLYTAGNNDKATEKGVVLSYVVKEVIFEDFVITEIWK
jgi:hypothetical protein